MQERIGNFIVEQIDGYIEVRTTSGNWKMAWGEGSFMYGLAMMFHAKGDMHILEPVIVLSHIASTVPLDGIALDEIFTSINSYAIRDGLNKVELEEQNDEEILEELKRIHDAEEATTREEEEEES